jgi:elongator complex protein 5
MMAHPNLAHRRTHNLLLISKLLNQRDNASPFTLVQDTLEQSAKPLIKEYIKRANVSYINSVSQEIPPTIMVPKCSYVHPF